MAKTYKRGDTITASALSRIYDAHASRLLADYLKESPASRLKGAQTRYTLKRALPTKDEYRAMLEKAYTSDVASLVSDAYSEAQALRDEMSEWRDNIEENFGGTSKYDEVSECADALDAFADDEPSIESPLDELPALYIPPAKLTSRGARLSDAAGRLQAAIDALGEYADTHGESEDEDERASADAARELSDTLEGDMSEMEGVSFPGMY